MMKLFSNGCPKCKILKSKLDAKDLKYEESDDIDFLIEKGFKSVPILFTDETYMEFNEAISYVNSIG